MPLHIAFGEIKEGTSMMREVMDETAVEVDKTKERLDFLFVGRNRPFSYSSNFSGVHLYGIVRYDHSEILHLGLLKFTFIRLQEQLVLLQECQDATGDGSVLLQCFHEY